MSTTATGASPWSSDARTAEKTSISKNPGLSSASDPILRNLAMVSLWMATSKTSSLPSADFLSDTTNQSRSTSLIGTGIYLRASIGTTCASCFSTDAGKRMTDTKLDEYGMDIAASTVVTLASRMTS